MVEKSNGFEMISTKDVFMGEKMGNRMTWNEMKEQFPDEWLLIVDYELDNSGHLIAGVVNRHSKDKDEVYGLPALNKSTAFRYTGESAFAGLRSRGIVIKEPYKTM